MAFEFINKSKAPRDFLPYESFPQYSIPEPEQWSAIVGEEKEFTLENNVILVSPNLDACIQYRKLFKESSKYYLERFKFKYQECVRDFDTLIHYFSEMYIEGLVSMIQRACSLLLPFGIFTVDIESFMNNHMDTYKKAITSYEMMVEMEENKNMQADIIGEQIGGAVQMQGGGFGLKGAMKGVAQAEAINIGIGLFGKYIASQNKMTQGEKAEIFKLFDHALFFQEVHSDYFNTFLTMVQALSDNGELENVKATVGTEIDTMFQNLQNPMFPQDKMAAAFVKMISSNPFETACFGLLRQKFGDAEEVDKIISYFVGRDGQG